MILNLLTAFKAEANAFIEYYDLKNKSSSKLFPIYENKDCYLIISGPGKIAAAAASAYLYQYCKEQEDQLWCNIGIAGHKSHSIGTLILADKIIDTSSEQCWYPAHSIKHTIQTAELHSVDQPETNYKNAVLYDMEASGFYSIASKCTTRELAQCFKVVSDNTESPINKLIIKKSGGLIENALPEIIQHIEKLRMHGSTIKNLDNSILEQILNQWRFTVTEQHQLKSCLQRLQILEPTKSFGANQLKNCESAAKALTQLKQHVKLAAKTVFCDD